MMIGGDWNHGILNDFPFSWEFHHPNRRTPSFFMRGSSTTTQNTNYVWLLVIVVYKSHGYLSWSMGFSNLILWQFHRNAMTGSDSDGTPRIPKNQHGLVIFLGIEWDIPGLVNIQKAI
jgi:hypothetical protein